MRSCLLFRLLIRSVRVVNILETNRQAENHVLLELLGVLAAQQIAGLTELKSGLWNPRKPGLINIILDLPKCCSKQNRINNTYAKSQSLHKLLLELWLLVADEINGAVVHILDLGTVLH